MAEVKSDRAKAEIDVKERARELGNRIQTTSGQTPLVRLQESRLPATSPAAAGRFRATAQNQAEAVTVQISAQARPLPGPESTAPQALAGESCPGA